MSDTNTKTAEVQGHDIRLKFHQKDLPIEKLYINPENLRFKAGMKIDGIQVVDTYNSGTLKDVIKAQGGVPGRLVVEEFKAPNGPLGSQFKPGEVYYITLAGNRRLNAAKELVADGTTGKELVEMLQKLPCNIYVDLDDQQRRELVNDQRSQRYQRAELVAYCWRLQAAGLTFSQIAMFVWPQMIGYTGQGQKMLPRIEACKDLTERTKVVTQWLKGTLDTIILSCGRMGPRVRRALLLSDMLIDGIAPVIGKDSEGEPIYEKPEFKPSQGRCSELARAKKADEQSPGGWDPEKGGAEFNATIAKFIREDKGLNEAGEPIPPQPVRKSIEALKNQRDITNSRVGKAALEIAAGKEQLQFADFDAEAKRLEDLVEVGIQYKDGIKDAKVAAFLKILLTGDKAALANFLAANS